ncbi:competence protein ComEA [Corynebacterium sp. HMSC036E10]|uniref:ComEA family DNA-binding protein n=1 Tax=Corynebacterium TaxID=1716 RepID=UPI0008A3DD53|nr:MULTISPECIES: ComEA family DNA-binding protein [Corynebacterium]MDK6492851.1 ComEA family DNA-binding protein [Corynebacterium coyleae]MDK8799606.1 ComEA family DNA-binding protein [Corynebacterium coyleae]MDK8823289.1 ComEA family DNA-binding protein [Corynebacterium coyleae]OFU51837.1 competence protein ComEA [Corynebacterium sp. HMSC11D10]OHO79827.1 competence protein ComEA [Corynebacterium sp. HMSC036E10]
MNATERLKELTRPTGEEDLLTVRYPEPRVRIPVKQAAAAAGAVLLAVGGWAVTRSGPVDDEGVAWEQVASPTEVTGTVVVSVVGEVENPGLITLNQGARVADALQTARPLPDADLISINHAQLLVDGQQIHVRSQHAPPAATDSGGGAGAGGAAASAGGVVSINSASVQELTTITGVGPSTAAAIVAHREANGPFASVDALTDVKGIGPAKLAAMRDQVGL